MKKRLITLLPCLALLASGCSSGGGDNTVTINIWEDESNKEMVQHLAEEFVTEYRQHYDSESAPKIEIVVTSQSEQSAMEEMTRGISESGNGPDIAAVTHDTIVSGYHGKILAPASHADGLKYRMSEDALNAVTVEDQVYGYPITAESTTIMYDSSKVSADELASFDALLASGKKLSWNLTGDNGGYYTFGLLNDATLFGEDGKDAKDVKLATDQSTQNVLDFFTKYKDCFIDETPEDAVASVTSGRTVGVVSAPYILTSMKKAVSSLKLAKLPAMGEQELRPFSGYKAYVVSKYSKNGAIAQELCNYLTSADANLYRLKKAGYLPALDLSNSEYSELVEEIQGSDESKAFASSLEESIVMPNISEMSNFWKPMNNAMTKFKNNSASLTLASVKADLVAVENTLLGK